MRNTEQLLGSLGLFSYRVGSLKSCNEAVSVHGPENTRCYDRIQVKLRTGQQTAVTKSNIHVISMSGKIMSLDRFFFLYLFHLILIMMFIANRWAVSLFLKNTEWI